MFGFVSLVILLGVFSSYLSFTLQNSSSIDAKQIYFAADPTTFEKRVSQSDSKTGLETFLSLNTTYLYPDRWISIRISENNTRSSTNILSSSDEWPILYHSLLPCSENYPIGIAVLAGFYTDYNITMASETQLLNFLPPGAYNSCPAVSASMSYSFESSGNLVNISNACSDQMFSGYFVPMTETLQLNGSWTSSEAGSIESPLTAGIYTVAGTDEWGNIVILHFAVTDVGIVSVIGPLEPSNAGGPAVSITLVNLANVPITSLNAYLRFESQIAIAESYLFTFPMNQSNPLLPNQSVRDTETLVGAGFASNQVYHLIVSGKFEDGVKFTFTDLVVVSPPT
jgi:hypothetical protein